MGDEIYKEKYLIYKEKYLKLQAMKKNNMLGGDSKTDRKLTVEFYAATWCGHCVRFQPTWEKLQEKFKNKYTFIKFDSETDKEIMKKQGINSYPTIKIKNKNKSSEYTGDRDYDTISNFLNKIN